MPRHRYWKSYEHIKKIFITGVAGFLASHLADRPNEVKLATCSSEKARKLLGYKTQTTLAEGIRQMVEDIKAKGAKEFNYQYPIEINNEKTPETWKKRLL